MTGRDIVTQVLWTAQALEGAAVPRLLQENSALITASLLDFLNEAIRMVVTRCPQATAVTESLQLEPGMRQHIPSRKRHRSRADALTLLRLTRNMGADGAPGTPVLAAELEMLMAWGSFGTVTTNAGIQNYAYDPLSNPELFWVLPAVPECGEIWVEVTYSARPEPLRSIDDLLPVPDDYEQALIHAVLSRIFSADADQKNLALAVQYQQACSTELEMRRQATDFAVAGRGLQ